MNEICYLIGDATAPQADGAVTIAHVCNNLGRWGAGFVLAISRRWPQPRADYLDWSRGRHTNDFALGAVRHVQVAPQVWVANMIAQHGIGRGAGIRPIRYGALEQCLNTVAAHAMAHNATVHMPRIGCGLAGGRWEEVEPLVRRTLCARGVPVTVYDLAGGERSATSSGSSGS